ncbi:hypothetical protein D3C72_1443340 [compost metagenome]
MRRRSAAAGDDQVVERGNQQRAQRDLEIGARLQPDPFGRAAGRVVFHWPCAAGDCIVEAGCTQHVLFGKHIGACGAPALAHADDRTGVEHIGRFESRHVLPEGREIGADLLTADNFRARHDADIERIR